MADVNKISIKIDPTLLKAGKILRGNVVKLLRQSGDLVQNQIRKTTEFKDRTGFLRGHILRDKVDEKNLSVTVTAHVADPPYGMFLNEGTRHIKAMRFMETGLENSSRGIDRIFGRIKI